MYSTELPVIAKIRAKKGGISQDKHSRPAEIAYSAITEIEFGAMTVPTVATMLKIAKGSGVSINEVVFMHRKTNTSKNFETILMGCLRSDSFIKSSI